MFDWAGLQADMCRRNKIVLSFLAGLSFLYGKAVRYRLFRSYRRKGFRRTVPARVISVGNIVAGGTGKTPMVKWLCRYFQDKGLGVSVVTRGYGRRGKKDGVIVLAGDIRGLSWSEVGDEPYMLYRQLGNIPVVVGRDRYECASEAIRRFGSRIIIMDDGFQHWRLERDVDLVLLDCRKPFDNGFLIPLGKLREPVSHLVRSDAFILTRVPDSGGEKETKSLLNFIFPEIPVFGSNHVPVAIKKCDVGTVYKPELLRGKRVLAFSGIGNSESFFNMIRGCGTAVCETISFPDHHVYTGKDIKYVAETARKKKTDIVITTEKDEVKLADFTLVLDNLYSLTIDIKFSDEASFCEWLDRRINL